MTPSTAAGRALFSDVDPMDMWESDGVTPEDICRVEAEAVTSERERIRSGVQALIRWHVGNHPVPAVPLAAVLDIIEESQP
ncbi:MAG: hypothetical protein IMZ66_12045 [Planctomycetes bacterium]|nr:hypothetical protein [Planctomycetota bacterium]